MSHKKRKQIPGKIRLAIVGSRTIDEFVLLERFGLGALRTLGFDITDIGEIVSGGAKGADMLSVELALKHKIPHLTHVAEWIRSDGSQNKRAGFERNALIVEYCDAAIVLWDRYSNGTADTLAKLSKAKKPYILIETDSIFVDVKKHRTEITLGGTYFESIKEWDKLYAKKKEEANTGRDSVSKARVRRS